VIRVGAEPVGEQAARTPCSHDDEVEFGDGVHIRHRSSLASDACPSVRCPPGTRTFPCVLWQSTVSSSSRETKTSWPIVVVDARASRRGRASENGIPRLGPIGENRWAAEQYAVDYW
jgi:hypothetical protein